MSKPDSGVPVSHLRLFLHDLNNEMFAAAGNLQLHELQKGKPEAERSLAAATRAAEELQTLIAEMSDYASWCGEGLPAQAIATDLAGLANSGVERAAASLLRHGKTARVENAAAAIRVVADASFAVRAIHGLIRASLWRGACGDVVPVTLGTQEGLGVVSVEDRGPVIPAEVVSRIFTVEGMLESKSKAAPPGRPTALLFARIVAESLGGRCWARSEAGSTRFSVGFPLAQ